MKKGKEDYTRYLNVNEFSNNIFTKQKYKKQRVKWGFAVMMQWILITGFYLLFQE